MHLTAIFFQMIEIELWRDRQNMTWDLKSNRPFSKMAAENSNKLIKISQKKKKNAHQH